MVNELERRHEKSYDCTLEGRWHLGVENGVRLRLVTGVKMQK